MYANCLEKALNNKKQMRVVLKAVADIQGQGQWAHLEGQWAGSMG
jgi:hypothetical protein